MKKLFLFIIIPSFCFSQTQIKNLKSEIIFKGPLYIQVYSIIDTSVNRNEREIIDSLNFTSVIERFKSGAIHFKVSENRLTKLYYWRQFYQNGNIKEEGSMTKDELIRIGNWKFYYESGILKNMLNFDSTFKVSYATAIKIAKKQGYAMPKIDIDIVVVKNKHYWQIKKWLMKNGDGISSTILINTIDGNISKPPEEVERHN